MTLYKIYLTRTASKWLKRKDGSTLLIKVVPNFEQDDDFHESGILEYLLYEDDLGMFDAYMTTSPPGFKAAERRYLGRVLFDNSHNWVYDGEALNVFEEEQLASFICNCDNE